MKLNDTRRFFEGREPPEERPELERVPADEAIPELTRGRSWAASILGGALCTALVFVFLGYLQPTMSSSEAISLPDIVKLETGLGSNRRPPPRPKEQRQEKVERKSQQKPKQVVRQSVARNNPARAQQNVRQLANLPSMNLDLNIGVSGGGATMAIAMPVGTEEDEREARAVEEYVRTRDEVRRASYDRSRGTGPGAFGAGGVTEPRLIFQPPPNYPLKAREQEIEGDVYLKVLVSVDGSITEFEILGARPQGVFDEAVIESLPRWRFSPAKDAGGRPIEFWKDIKIQFRLEE